jgi:hypothetical protein
MPGASATLLHRFLKPAWFVSPLHLPPRIGAHWSLPETNDQFDLRLRDIDY